MGQRIGCIYTAVLATSAAKVHSQAGKPALNILLHANVNNIKYRVEEILHPRLALQVFHHRFIASMMGFVLFMTTRVINTATVEHKATAIATIVFWYPFLIRKGADLHY